MVLIPKILFFIAKCYKLTQNELYFEGNESDEFMITDKTSLLEYLEADRIARENFKRYSGKVGNQCLNKI